MSFLLISLIAPTSAARLVVDDDGDADFTDLQEAIDAAAEGDTLLVRNGSYTAGGLETLTHGNGAEHDWCGVLFLDKGVEIIGESTGGVVVDGETSADCERTGAIVGRAGASSVRNLTLVHDAPGWSTDAASYSALTTLALTGVEDHFIHLSVENVVIRMDDSSHESVLMYLNGADSGMLVLNTTVDVQGPAMMTAWVNSWGTGYLFDSIIVDNIDTDFQTANGLGSGAIEGDYALLHGYGFSSETMLDAAPMFSDPDNLDYTLQADSPAIDAGNPEASRNDADGSRNDLGAHGGPDEGFPVDWDGDGFSPDGSVGGTPDCDDLDGSASPGSDEICDDGVDNDCDGEIDPVELCPVDEDPDSDPDGEGEGEEGGCSSVPAAPLSAMAALLGGLALIRRRR